jgi:hypothetical protein
VESWSAGAHGWLVLYGTSVLASLVMLVIDPPKLEPESFQITRVIAGVLAKDAGSAHAVLWILIATGFYELDRRGRRRSS